VGAVGFLVKIWPLESEPWIGNFSNSGFELKQEVFATPNENWICINAHGVVYLVNTLKPVEYIKIPIIPVVDILISKNSGYLLLIGFTDIALFDLNGLRWVKEVSADGIKITEIGNERISGTAWDPPKNKYTEFVVDVLTGELSGGSRY